MDVDAYLERIGLTAPVETTRDDLERLQRAHLTSVPFENLDVFHRRGVETGEDWSVPKIVETGRGGWCFELNGAFAALLTAVGFSVKRLAATVLIGEISTIPTHLTMEVWLDRPYLVDVGFGDSFISPLPLDSSGPHQDAVGEFGFVFEDTMTTLVWYGAGGTAEPQYRFDPTPKETTDFDRASNRLQSKAGLQWTDAPFATRLLDGGPDRVTLLRDRIKFRRSGVWTEEPVDQDEWPDLLYGWFDMTP